MPGWEIVIVGRIDQGQEGGIVLQPVCKELRHRAIAVRKWPRGQPRIWRDFGADVQPVSRTWSTAVDTRQKCSELVRQCNAVNLFKAPEFGIVQRTNLPVAMSTGGAEDPALLVDHAQLIEFVPDDAKTFRLHEVNRVDQPFATSSLLLK